MTPEIRAHYTAFRHDHPDMPAYVCHLWAIRRAQVTAAVSPVGPHGFVVTLDGVAVMVTAMEDAYGPDECERRGDLAFVMFASVKGAMLDCIGGIEVGPWWEPSDTDEQGWYMREMAYDVACGAVALYTEREMV